MQTICKNGVSVFAFSLKDLLALGNLFSLLIPVFVTSWFSDSIVLLTFNKNTFKKRSFLFYTPSAIFFLNYFDGTLVAICNTACDANWWVYLWKRMHVTGNYWFYPTDCLLLEWAIKIPLLSLPVIKKYNINLQRSFGFSLMPVNILKFFLIFLILLKKQIILLQAEIDAVFCWCSSMKTSRSLGIFQQYNWSQVFHLGKLRRNYIFHLFEFLLQKNETSHRY